MNHRQLAVLGAALVAGASVVIASCSSSSSCLTGCTDEAGTCQAGTTAAACGAPGTTCEKCGTGQTCFQSARCMSPSNGGGFAGSGGGTASSGGGTASSGGGTASSGGGTASSGGGTASSGGGTASSGGGTASSGGGTASSGGGTGSTGGGTSGAGGGAACVPTPVGACEPNTCATGNNLHVGAYCTKNGGQCTQYGLSCAIDLSTDGANFCIKLLCSDSSGCGASACCVGDGSNPIKACIPIGCAVDDGGTTCPP